MARDASSDVTLFLCGDVMTGRGVDQILAHPGSPRLTERYVRSALDYVELAERATGPIPRRVEPAYLWGDALAELERARPAARIINLETAVTAAEDAWPDKAVNYRMHPANTPCLAAARLDCCVLANNHSLDWGRAGLADTLAALHAAGIATAGAGRDDAQAASPAAIELGGGARALVFAYGLPSSGVPGAWAARPDRSGVNYLADLSPRALDALAAQVAGSKRAGDIVVASLHWGGNWGYDIEPEERAFAHGMIDRAGVDLVYGHSSHHAKGIEVHRGKAILYGCGDFIDDYEGIGGYESFRPDLALMVLPTLDVASGRLLRLRLVPMQIRHFRLQRAAEAGARWLAHTLSREGRALGTRVQLAPDGSLALSW